MFSSRHAYDSERCPVRDELLGEMYRANEHGLAAYLDRVDRQHLESAQGLLGALVTWHTWATGQPVATPDLAAATATFTSAARHTRLWSTSPDELDHDRYNQLLLPVIAQHPELEATLRRPRLGLGDCRIFGVSGPVSYTHLTLPTTPYV